MAAFHLTNAAKADLKDIGRYTQKRWDIVQRNQYLSMLDRCFQELAAEPFKGRDCSDIRDGYRRYRAGSHVIFYRQVAPDTLEIVRVLHSRMDIEPRFLESEGC